MVDINKWDSVWKGKGTSDKPYQIKSRLEKILLNGTIDKVIDTLDKVGLSLKKEIITTKLNIILNSQKYLIEKRVTNRDNFHQERYYLIGNKEYELYNEYTENSDCGFALIPKNLKKAVVDAYGIKLSALIVMERGEKKETKEEDYWRYWTFR